MAHGRGDQPGARSPGCRRSRTAQHNVATGAHPKTHLLRARQNRRQRQGQPGDRGSGQESREPACRGRALFDLAWAYGELERRRPNPNLGEAETHARQAVDLCDGAGDVHGKVQALNGLARILGYRNQHAEALHCYEEALAISQERRDLKAIGTSHCNIGTLHFVRNDYDLALASYLRSLEILDALDFDSYGITMLIGNIAEVYRLTGTYDKALSYESRRLALARAYGYTMQEAESLLATGDIQSCLGDTLRRESSGPSQPPSTNSSATLAAARHGNASRRVVELQGSTEFMGVVSSGRARFR
ncbi:tetratricopeptide repeat protein [Streptacidiphilus monticola]